MSWGLKWISTPTLVREFWNYGDAPALRYPIVGRRLRSTLARHDDAAELRAEGFVSAAFGLRDYGDSALVALPSERCIEDEINAPSRDSP